MVEERVCFHARYRLLYFERLKKQRCVLYANVNPAYKMNEHLADIGLHALET